MKKILGLLSVALVCVAYFAFAQTTTADSKQNTNDVKAATPACCKKGADASKACCKKEGSTKKCTEAEMKKCEGKEKAACNHASTEKAAGCGHGHADGHGHDHEKKADEVVKPN
ncbi:MAG: hypothetical protein RIQ89_1109 [Bacteroidota bacterium]|jgi:hypothetical protein